MRWTTTKLVAVAVVVAALAVGVVVGQRALDPPPAAPPVDAAACAVYRSFHAHVDGTRTGVYFKSTTQSFGPPLRRMANVVEAVGGLRPERHDEQGVIESAPKRFRHLAGGSDRARIVPPAPWPGDTPVRQPFDMDTSRFFQPVKDNNSMSIKPCFETATTRAKFHDGSFQHLSLREKLFAFGAHRDVVVRNVSPVGFAADGRHALLYGEYLCNVPCAGGTFYLFEKRDGTWTVIGESPNWAWGHH